MKKTSEITVILWITTLIFLASCSRNKPVILRFSNPLPIYRNLEVIKINYNDFSNAAGDLPTGMLPLFLDGTDTLTSQNIDLNSDGIPEEILVEISLPASGNKDVKVEFVRQNTFPAFPEKTNLHFANITDTKTEIISASRVQSIDTKVTSTVFQLEGPGWENDKVGFRNYFDLRNGLDIFGKKYAAMVLDTIGTGKHSYHLMSNWGMDILKVGNSLGAGGIAVEKEGRLYRIGDNGNSSFERIIEGPLKSEFALHFNKWKAGNDSLQVIQYISITAGMNCYEAEVYADLPDTAYSLVSGIVNKHNAKLLFENAGESYLILGDHAIQAEDTTILGMALLIPRKCYQSFGETPYKGEGITETIFARLTTTMKDPAHYYFYAGWATGNPEFATQGGFINLIREDALKLENPVRMTSVKLP